MKTNKMKITVIILVSVFAFVVFVRCFSFLLGQWSGSNSNRNWRISTYIETNDTIHSTKDLCDKCSVGDTIK